MINIAKVRLSNDAQLIEPAMSGLLGALEHTGLDAVQLAAMGRALRGFLVARQATAFAGPEGAFDISLDVEDEVNIILSVRDQGIPYYFQQDFLLADGRGLTLDLSHLEGSGVFFAIAQLGHLGQEFALKTKLPQSFAPSAQTEIHERPTDDVFHVEALRPEDDQIIEAVRCIYDEYGFSYCYERLYNIDHFKRSLLNGEVQAFLARNQSGQVAGHTSLRHSPAFPDLPELSSLVVKRDFRRLGAGGLLVDDSLERVKNSTAKGALSFPSLFSADPQKMLLERDFVPTGLLLNYTQAEMRTSGGNPAFRLPLGIAVRLFRTDGPLRLHPPAEYRDFFAERCRALGLEADFQPPAAPTAQRSKASVESAGLLKASFVYLDKIGLDFESALHDYLLNCRLEHQEMVVLHISLRDPAAASACRTAERLGFHFMGGILGGSEVDYLVMQHFMNVPIYLETIRPLGAFKEIADHCLSLLPDDLKI